MDHPYILQAVNNIHQSEIQERAAANRLALSYTASSSRAGVISRLISYFKRSASVTRQQDVLTTQELRTMKFIR